MHSALRTQRLSLVWPFYQENNRTSSHTRTDMTSHFSHYRKPVGNHQSHAQALYPQRHHRACRQERLLPRLPARLPGPSGSLHGDGGAISGRGPVGVRGNRGCDGEDGRASAGEEEEEEVEITFRFWGIFFWALLPGLSLFIGDRNISGAFISIHSFVLSLWQRFFTHAHWSFIPRS